MCCLGSSKLSLHDCTLKFVPSFSRVTVNMANVVGQSKAEKAILSNHRYTAEEALSIGLVDKVLAKDKVMEETKSEMEKWVMYSGRRCEFIMFGCKMF